VCADVKDFETVGATLGLAEHALGAAVILGYAFSGFAFFLVAVTLHCLVACMTGFG
jgi:hypothetical protein